MITVDFLNSDVCMQLMRLALTAKKTGDKEIIPIIVRNCLWKETTLKSKKVLPDTGFSISDKKSQNREDAYVNVAKGIKRVVEKFS